MFVPASSQFLTVASTPITAYPFSLSAWGYPDALGINQTLASICISINTTDRWELIVTTGNVLRFGSRSSSVTVNADATGTVSVNTWFHALAVGTSATSRTIYRDGGNSGTNTTSNTPGGTMNQWNIGRRGGSTSTTFWSGRLAEVALWNAALSADEALALARGVLPWRIRPLSLVGYWPVWGFQSPEIDLTSSARSMTVTGATLANHAPVRPFSRSLWGSTPLIEVAAAGGAARQMMHYKKLRAG